MAFVVNYVRASQRTPFTVKRASCSYSGLSRTRPLPTRRPRGLVQKESGALCNTTRVVRCMASSNSTRPNAKELAKLYGGSYLGTSIGLSIVSYLVLYAMISLGVDVPALMNSLGDFLAMTPLGRPSVLDNISEAASTAALAYIAHKAMSPLRFPLTVAATPIVASFFSKKDSESDDATS